ncbi:flagellar assembly peptidoglycan hydrolase FlgJ [Frateuria sp. STR12]|uniref:flagellar assembly peptidoglycan hydrolase FlgJ n=1 Tax=Frateuria hangzhouensis TaxID=2995589 RepID=UPI002260BA48|nr:flagellar assembly peptidoglycan hydrolase FlgJ [Frateuria sp. STR12]MCX7513130.1 flagellar assembly peptidoglycan hydrolase FlgJ [Frateuria sp. STR12]
MTPANASLPALDTWTDLSGFAQLRAQAKDNGKAALPKVAKQFEAIFTQMMLKSMRDANASFGDNAMGDSQQGKAYRDLFDQQLSLSLSQGNNGLGIARLLVRQLGGKDAEPKPAPVTDNKALLASVAAGALPAGAAASLFGPLAAGAQAGTRALLHLGEPADGQGGGLLPLTADAHPAQGWRATLGELAHTAADVVSKFVPGDPAGFVRAMAPHAQAAADKLGVSVRALLAQAALETGWGKHLPHRHDGSSSFNLFGIKAGSRWDGDKVSVPTLEYEGGVAVRKRDNFRAYDSPTDAFSDYARLLADNPRYARALGQGENIAGFAHALSRGGYATDPAYAAKLTSIANSPQMREALAALDEGTFK